MSAKNEVPRRVPACENRERQTPVKYLETNGPFEEVKVEDLLAHSTELLAEEIRGLQQELEEQRESHSSEIIRLSDLYTSALHENAKLEAQLVCCKHGTRGYYKIIKSP